MSHHNRGPSTADAAYNTVNEWWNEFQQGEAGQPVTPQTGASTLTPSEMSTMRSVLDHDITQSYNDALVALQQVPDEYAYQPSQQALRQVSHRSGLQYKPYQTQKPEDDPLPVGFSLNRRSRGFYGSLNGTSASQNNLRTDHSAFGDWHQDQAFLADINGAENYATIFTASQASIDAGNVNNAGHYNDNDDLKAIETAGDKAVAHGGSPMRKLNAEIAETEKILTGSPDGHGKGGYEADWGYDAHSVGTGPFDNPAQNRYENPKDDGNFMRHHLNKTTILNDIVRAEALPQDEYGSSQGNSSWFNGHSWKSYYENYNDNGILDDNDPYAIGTGPNQTVTGEPYLSEINGASATYPDPHTYLPEEVKETDRLCGLPDQHGGSYNRFYAAQQAADSASGRDQLSQTHSEGTHHDGKGDAYAVYRHDLDDHAPDSTLEHDLKDIDHNRDESAQIQGRNGKIFDNLALVDADFHSMMDLKTHNIDGQAEPLTPHDAKVNWGDGSPTEHYKYHSASLDAILPDADADGPGRPDLNHQAESESINVDGTPADISGEAVGGTAAQKHTAYGNVETIDDLKNALTSEKEEFKGLSTLATDLKAQKELATHDLLGHKTKTDPVLSQNNILGSQQNITSNLNVASNLYSNRLSGDQTKLQDQEDTLNILTAQNNLSMDHSQMKAEWDGYHQASGQFYEGTVARCFVTGTMIKTIHGEKAVEDLSVGDHVLTKENNYQPIKDILHDDMIFGQKTPKSHDPICIQKNAFSPGVPAKDLYVSGGHGIYFKIDKKGKSHRFLVPARLLINGKSIRRVQVRKIRYYHILLPQHDLITSDGIWSESYYPVEAGKPTVLHRLMDKIRTILGMSCALPGEVLPRYKSGQWVRQVRQNLLERSLKESKDSINFRKSA